MAKSVQEGCESPWLLSIAGVIYGFTYFAIILEGGTAPLGLPFAILAVSFVLIFARKKLRQEPLIFFFLIAYLVAIALFTGWAIYWGGLPQFSEVGIIE